MPVRDAGVDTGFLKRGCYRSDPIRKQGGGGGRGGGRGAVRFGPNTKSVWGRGGCCLLRSQYESLGEFAIHFEPNTRSGVGGGAVPRKRWRNLR